MLGGRVPDPDALGRADVRADLDAAMEAGDMDRVRERMAELEDLEGDGA